MHQTHKTVKTNNGPETRGATLHRVGHYDLFSGLFGLGENSSNSRMIVEMAKIQPGYRVLEVGCGTGNLALTAKRYAGLSGSVYGIDASPEMINVASQKIKRNGSEVVFEVGLIEKIPYPENSFDVVLSRLMVHHLPDKLKRQGFAEVFRILKSGGLFLIVDFKPPENPVLAHVALLFAGHRMMRTNVWAIPPMLTDTGFVEVNSGPTHSAFLAFVRGKKPTITP